MTDPTSNASKASLNDDRKAQLRAELKAPYRGIRRFLYLGGAASAWIGGLVFFAKLVAGESPKTTLPNLLLQVGIFALMVWLFRVDRARDQA